MKGRGFTNVGRWVGEERVLAERLWMASGFWGRLIGLQFARGLPNSDAVMLRNCRSVHTAWMRFDLQLVFLDDQYRVVEIRDRVKPWRVVLAPSDEVRHVIERAAGHGSDVRVGMQTHLIPVHVNEGPAWRVGGFGKHR